MAFAVYEFDEARFRAAIEGRPLRAAVQIPEDAIMASKAERNAWHAERVAKWRKNAPYREAAQRAMERANRIRAWQLGVLDEGEGDPEMPAVAAALDWMRPERPQFS